MRRVIIINAYLFEKIYSIVVYILCNDILELYNKLQFVMYLYLANILKFKMFCRINKDLNKYPSMNSSSSHNMSY